MVGGATAKPVSSDWSRRLPRPFKIPDVMTLRTLADVRKLIGHLPAERRQFDAWRHMAEVLGRGPPAAAT